MSFALPPELEAPSPPEYRGMTRDSVRMLVATKSDGTLVHSHFSELPRFLNEGDLVVINASGTLALSSTGRRPTDRPSRCTSPRSFRPGSGPSRFEGTAGADLGASAGDVIELPEGGRVALLAAYSPGPGGGGVRLWVSRIDTPERLYSYLAIHGRPIRYGYVRGSYPITAYQNVYATEPGSADAERRAPLHPRGPHPSGGQGRRHCAGAAPHRCGLAGGE